MDLSALLTLGTTLINFATSVKDLMRFDLPAKERIGIAKLTPVIFSGTAGKGGEYHAPADPNKPAEYILDTKIPADTKIVGAWYTPLHNIPAINAFGLIDVERHNDTQIKLLVAAFPNINARLRIAIHVLYAK
jgi:hypothetical protein